MSDAQESVPHEKNPQDIWGGRFDGFGKCIYCGAQNVKLTDEHIVPLSLGGQHIIVKASCLSCAKTTGRFERDVARDLWGDMRTSYNAPSRRKRERRTHIVLPDAENPSRNLKIPYREYPAPVAFYVMERAGLLMGLPEAIDISSAWKVVMLSNPQRNNEFMKKYRVRLTARFRHVPESFARMIAKIGYGQVLLSLNPNDFGPICLPYILGTKKNLSYIVGCDPQSRPPEVGVGYLLRTAGFGTVDRMMVLAEVRLFAGYDTPTYHIIVGEVLGREQVSSVITKLYASKVSVATHSPGPIDLSKQPHWGPACWPLPYWNAPPKV